MTRNRLALAVPLLLASLLPVVLAACDGADTSNPRYAGCQAQVNADPQVRDLMMKYAGSVTSDQQSMFDPNPLRRQKMKDCLRDYPADSGVESVRESPYTFKLF
jgi:hypothetical protein